jgi:hypothetical protein
MRESTSRSSARRRVPVVTQALRGTGERAGERSSVPVKPPRMGFGERRVLSDVIRVLPVALLVGVLPGWFWTRCLLASEDYAERLAYAIALSLTLVPAVALAQVYLFGTGVTSAVAAASAVLVFLTGLTAYLALGPAKGGRHPSSGPPHRPGFPRWCRSPPGWRWRWGCSPAWCPATG